MARIDTLKNFLTDIADKFREKLGTTDAISHAEYDTKIDEIYDAGYGVGHTEGFADGTENGKLQQREEFWNEYTNNNTKIYYNYCFAGAGENAFDPPFAVKIRNAEGCFRQSKIKKITSAQMDTSELNNPPWMFYGAAIEELGVMDFRNATNLSACFYAVGGLHTIEKVIFKEDGSSVTNYTLGPFTSCGGLQNIVIEGKIGDTITFGYCPKLTSASIESIVNALLDTATDKTLTFATASKTVYYNAHSSEYADADEAWDALCDTKPNWTISLV